MSKEKIPGMQEFGKQLAAKIEARKKQLAKQKQTSETNRDDKPKEE